MCFYCCALKFIFSFLSGALGLSGSLNSVSSSVQAMTISFIFSPVFFALLCWMSLRITLPGISLAMRTGVVSGWVLSPPGPALSSSMLLMNGRSGIGAFPQLSTCRGKLAFS